ncbi:hypothetical protein [Saccharospirillum impatiens]|uniref:hypothetical protein n=1 Tax=Saccharospirillum impatiens TaxID=169438 RepID=UPI0004024EB3|nr:hypothetical protein [Saccharospirillum impatiens]
MTVVIRPQYTVQERFRVSLFAVLFMLLMIALIVGGLYMSRVATQREQEALAIKARLRQLRAQQTQYEELFSTLMIYDRDPDLLYLIQQNLAEESENLLAIDPTNQDSQRDVAYYQSLAEDIGSLGDKAHQPEIPSSDRQINLMKRHFGRAMKWVRTLNARGLISEIDSHEHLARLNRNSLMLEVEAYKRQGLEARDQNDLSAASSFYKHAKDLLIHSDIQINDKSQQIKKISRLISGLYDSTMGEDTSAASDSQSASTRD